MDLARIASNRLSLIPTVVLIFLLFGNAVPVRAADDQLTHRAKQLFADRRWQEIAGLGKSAKNPSADFAFYYGTALAQLGRLAEAQNAFAAGARLQPQDKRFPLEQAGVSFKAKSYPQAARYLRRALRIDPLDSYGNNFLGTVYFLQGNIDAALKYWNRVDKPRIAEVQTAPLPQVKPALLDRAFVFAPASVLLLSDLLTTDVRIRNLGIFPSYQFDLRARDDSEYDILFRNGERNGWGSTKLEKLFLLLRGLPQLTVTPEIYNLRHEAINFISMYRWDAEKRRVSAELSAPFKGNPKFRYGLLADLRGENWNIRQSFTGPAPLLGSFNMRRESVAASFSSFESGRWRWSAGAEVSHRDFRSVVAGVALTPGLLAKGYQLKQSAQLDVALWRWPERRLGLEGGVSSQAGRLWSQPAQSFEKLQGFARFNWFPQSEGDDYEVQQRISAGKRFGSSAFDELFVLGIGGDNDLWMRGHIATRDGRKGSAPLGGNYFLSNWEADKNVYHNGIITVKFGPFLDTGKISDESAALGSREWLWDLGAQAKVRVFGVGIVFSYGKDLRSGNNAFFVSMR